MDNYIAYIVMDKDFHSIVVSQGKSNEMKAMACTFSHVIKHMALNN